MVIYDVIVVGLGAMGTATCYQLAKSGVNVLGIDRYNPPHQHGSTHGDMRITRLAVGEGAEYVPLAMRSHKLWREIEQESGQQLLSQCGGLIMSVPNNQGLHGIKNFFEQTAALADLFAIKHELLNADQIHSRFPQFHLIGNETGYYEPEAGFLKPEVCIRAQRKMALRYGAVIHTNEQVTSFRSDGKVVVVHTNKTTYKTPKLVITAGAWINDLLNGYGAIFKIYRQVLWRFALKDKSFYESYNDLPIFIWSFGTGPSEFVSGAPTTRGLNRGMTVETDDYSTDTTPDNVQRNVTPDEIARMYLKNIKDKLPGLTEKCLAAKVCLYTVTPDHKFVIDYHPQHNNVLIASPCSGHGFKHSVAIGEVLAQIATKGRSDIDISPFALSRFNN